MDFIKPDYKNCNINISATLAEFLGAPNKNATLPLLEEELKKGYKNVVFICFDGLGIHPIEKNLDKEDLLRRNITQTLLSTFPSTTTNATSSLRSNLLPLEHGWFGWSMYFENIKRNINIFLDTDSWTEEDVAITNSPLLDIDEYYNNGESDYNINTVYPTYVQVSRPENNHTFESEKDFFEQLENICQTQGKQFVYAYYPDPDHTMHDYGVSSKEAKDVITSLSKNMERILSTTKDTLFIITADHGQVDVEGYVYFYKDEKLLNMLEIYPFLEPRAIAFKVKKGKEKEFEKYFNETYSKDFTLFDSKKLIEEGYFGDKGDKENLLGDYIAIGTYTHKIGMLTPAYPEFKGHHTSLTEEMEVPLILLHN